MRIAGIACAVPTNVITSEAFIPRFGRETVDKIVENIGVEERRHVRTGCTSDLAVAAAERLFDDLHVDRSTIDAVVLATKTPDWLSPATSGILQDRLGLPQRLVTFDLNLGCSGFTDGLILGQALLKGLALRKVLLLAGDTMSKVVSPDDQGAALLFGDAACAAILESSDAPFYHVIGRDGSGYSAIYHKFGYRQGLDAREPKLHPADIAFQMDGLEVLGFTLKCVPTLFTDILDLSGWNIETTDYFLYHQANAFMLKQLARRSKIPMEKFPIGITKFGNTCGASIPLMLVTELAERLGESTRLALFGFGSGLAWSAVAVEWKNGILCPLVEIDC